jgi:hypothetical protein
MTTQIEWEWRGNAEYPHILEYYVGGRMVAWLQPRPHYCDRGHWQVNVDLPYIDGADGFPRYYMDRTRAIAETEAFVAWRLKPRN